MAKSRIVTELNIAAQLLELARVQFSNNCCNDFDLVAACGGDRDMAMQIADTYHFLNTNGRGEPEMKERYPDSYLNLPDYSMMYVIQKRLEVMAKLFDTEGI